MKRCSVCGSEFESEEYLCPECDSENVYNLPDDIDVAGGTKPDIRKRLKLDFSENFLRDKRKNVKNKEWIGAVTVAE